MLSRCPGRLVLPFIFAAPLIAAAPAAAPDPNRPLPAPVPVAETTLLMQGINQPNFRGLERLLRQKPADVEAWTFARGQALLIAENANLLMLRPPRNQGRDAWLDRSADLREMGTRLARFLANRDYEGSRAGLVNLAGTCNRCHQTFRVPVRITAFAPPPDGARPAPRQSVP